MASLDRVYERGENPVLEEVTRHIETMVGPVAAVVPDPAPADLAIDVVMVEPTPARPEPPRAPPVQPAPQPPRPATPRPERPAFQPRPATPPPSYQPRPAPPGGGR